MISEVGPAEDVEEWGYDAIWGTGICLKGLKEATKTLSQNNGSPGRHLNRGAPEYEGQLLIRGRSLIHINEM
jgi:hypothetical protein